MNSNASGIDTLQLIIIGIIISSWVYTNFSPSIKSNPSLLYSLICSFVGLLVSYLPLISLVTRS